MIMKSKPVKTIFVRISTTTTTIMMMIVIILYLKIKSVPFVWNHLKLEKLFLGQRMKFVHMSFIMNGMQNEILYCCVYCLSTKTIFCSKHVSSCFPLNLLFAVQHQRMVIETQQLSFLSRSLFTSGST